MNMAIRKIGNVASGNRFRVRAHPIWVFCNLPNLISAGWSLLGRHYVFSDSDIVERGSVVSAKITLTCAKSGIHRSANHTTARSRNLSTIGSVNLLRDHEHENEDNFEYQL